MVVDRVVYDYVAFEMILDSNYQRHSHGATFTHVGGTLPAGLNRVVGSSPVRDTAALIMDEQLSVLGVHEATKGRIRGVLTSVANSSFRVRMENDAGFNDTTLRVNTARVKPEANPHLRGVVGSSKGSVMTELTKWQSGTTSQIGMTDIVYTGEEILDTVVTDFIVASNVIDITTSPVTFLSRYHGLGQPSSRFVGANPMDYPATRTRPTNVGTYRMLSSFNQGTHFLNVDSNEPCTLGTFRIIPARLDSLLGTLAYERWLPEQQANPRVSFPLPNIARFLATYDSTINVTDDHTLLIAGSQKIENDSLIFAVNAQSVRNNMLHFDITVNPGEAGNILATGNTIRFTALFVRPDELVEPEPFIQIDYLLENIGDFIAGTRYTINGDTIPENQRFISIDTVWMGTTINIVALPTHELMNPSKPFPLVIPVRPAAPKVETDSSVYGEANGALVFDSAAARQYRLAGATSWINVSTAKVDGLAPGIYEVRTPAPAGNTAFASYVATAVIETKDRKEETPTISINYQNATLVGFIADTREYTVSGSGVTETVSDVTSFAIDAAWFGDTVKVIALARFDEYSSDSDPQSFFIVARPETPEVAPVTTDSTASNGAITGVALDMEWRKTSAPAINWTAVEANEDGDPVLEGLDAGNYEVRVAAVAGISFASLIASVTVEVNVVERTEATPEVAINFVNETLTGFVSGSSYTIGGDDVEIDGTTLAIETAWFGSTVAIVTVGRGLVGHIDWQNSAAQNLAIPARASTPTGIVADTTSAAEKYGIITGVKAGMEYRLAGGTWIAITSDGDIDSLVPGDYEVRVAATATTFASSVVTVKVIDKSTSIADNNREIPGDREDDISIIIKGLSGEFTVGPNPVSKAAGSVGFFWAGKAIADGTLSVLDASGNLIANVSISDKSTNSDRREIGSWNLTNLRGVTVDEGTFIVRGVVTMKDGTKQRVSSVFAVVR
jgi:hypothetical protein